jgi:hypothetical protein
MHWKVLLWLSLFLALMIGYLLLLTVVLPSTLAYEPDWIRVGSFAEYSVTGGALNGTYAWNVTSIEIKNGRTLVTINETFRGTTQWDHVARWNGTSGHFENTIPISGKTTEISAAMGTVEDLILWLRRYYNHVLHLALFLGIPEHVWAMTGGGEISFQGQTRQFLHLDASEQWQWSRSADYDKTTGILMRYRWTWPRLGTVWVSLKSTNVFSSTSSEPGIFLDLILIAPLFMIPLVGALVGLYSAKHKRRARRQITISPNHVSTQAFILIDSILRGHGRWESVLSPRCPM